MRAIAPTFDGGVTVNGAVTVNGVITCPPEAGHKIEFYRIGPTFYGAGINPSELCLFGDPGSALTYRVSGGGGTDLGGIAAFRASEAGIALLPGATLAIGAHKLTLDANGALLVDGAPLPGGGGGASGTASITGGTIDATAVGNTTPAALRCTTLAVTGTLGAKSVLATPNAASGAPAWRQLLASDISNLGVLATVDPAAPPALGAAAANAGRFTSLTATEFVRRSGATGITASTTNTQAGATALTASVNNITTAAANTAVRLPATAPAAGTAAEIIVRNGGASAVNVFPATNAAINALAVNAAFSLAAGTSARFFQLSATLYITA